MEAVQLNRDALAMADLIAIDAIMKDWEPMQVVEAAIKAYVFSLQNAKAIGGYDMMYPSLNEVRLEVFGERSDTDPYRIPEGGEGA